MIGVPPYSPGDYLDVDEDDDGGVTIRLADYFRRPLRLTPAEGLALLAAGPRLLAVPGSDPEGPLATALGKLEARARAPRSRRRRRRARRTSTRSATRSHHHERVEIDYWSAGRDELDDRARSIPTSCSSRLGEWYVGAYCHRAERRAHVPRRPHPRAPARPASALRAGADRRFEIGEVYTPARRRPAGHAPTRTRRGVGRRGVSDRVGDGAARRDARGRARGERAGLARTAAPPARPRRRGRRPAGAARGRGRRGRRVLARYTGGSGSASSHVPI